MRRLSGGGYCATAMEHSSRLQVILAHAALIPHFYAISVETTVEPWA
jgi:hypothetical protein